MKKLLAGIVVLVVLCFVFSGELLYFASWWHERAGHVKKALADYHRIVERHPKSRFVERAREGIRRLEKGERDT